MSRTRLIAALAAACLCTLTAPALAAGDDCPKGFACSTVPVPLDRSGDHAGTIELRVARHRASAGTGKPALIVLAGGPGQAAVPFGPRFAHDLRTALSRYQLVVFDQRGTGASAPIRCPGVQRAGDMGAADVLLPLVAACGAALGASAGDYGTDASVADIEAVRTAVGADEIALVGTSYGTHVIQRYLLAHPDRLDRVVLDSTVPPGDVDGLQLNSYGATARVLRELQRGADRSTARLVARLARGPLRGRRPDARGRLAPVQLTSSGHLWNVFVGGDMSELLRTQYPAAVRAADGGDPAPILRLVQLAAGPPSSVDVLSAGLYWATACTDVRKPWANSSDPASRAPLFDASLAELPAGAEAPFDRAAVRETSVSGPCVGWPSISTPAADVPATYPAVPALILSGLSDVRTPVENARAVQARIPGSALVTVPGTGHAVLGSDRSGCAARALRRFLAGGRPRSGRCAASNGLDRPLRVFPRRLGAIRPTGGSGRSARAFTAALLTAQDAQDITIELLDSGRRPRFGGLRGGRVSATAIGDRLRVRLDRAVYLPGLRVSGTTTLGRAVTGTLRLSGLARGTVTLDRHGVRATIDGRRLRRPAWV